jgi:hypothetical protein
MIDGLTRLVKAGQLASLEIVNLSAAPPAARDAGVRSVPVAEIGPFRLEGALAPGELADWVEAVRNGEGWPAYYAHLLEHQRLDEVVQHVGRQRSCLAGLLGLLTSEDTSMTARIGIGAVLEELAGSTELRAVIPDLTQLTLAESPQTRADACHYLGLTGDATAIPAVERLLNDEHQEVREIAAETLAMLGADDGRG